MNLITTITVNAQSLPLTIIGQNEPNIAVTPATVSLSVLASGATTEVAPASDTAASGLNGRLQRIAQRITSLIGALGSPFQVGGSIGNTAFGVNNGAGVNAVNIQDGGNVITVDGTVGVTGTFWQAIQPVSITNATVSIDGIVFPEVQPVSGTVAVTGVATNATLTAQNVLIGSVVETAPTTDTETSGLNGRLQRIAQRLTTLIGSLGSPFQAGGSIGNTAFGVNNGSGAAAVNIQDGGNTITVDGTVAATQSGTWTVTGAGGTFPVTGTFWQATQPVSLASMPVTSVTGTFWQATQPVSASSLPLPTGAATSAIQTDGTQKARITNGTNDAAIKALNNQVTGADFGLITNSVLHGLSTAGGGTYVDVKVNPSGSLAVEAVQGGDWVISGVLDNGTNQPLSSTSEGHLEVAIHDPLAVFGGVSVVEDTPIFQTDFVYGINEQQVYTVATGSGTAIGVNQFMRLSTGITGYSYAVGESRKRLRYRPGQGVKCTFTAMYTTPEVNSYQDVGCGTSENGLYFGYGDTNDLNDTSFGILYVKGGKREIKTLTVTTGATSAGNVTITLNGTAFTAAVTNSSNIQRTVWEISQGTYAGWDAYPNGPTVVFIRKSSGTTAGTQTFGVGTTGSAATIAQTRAGVASTDTFYKQSTWNVDKLNGTGPSGYTINPQNINLYRILIGYLGAHDHILQVKVTPPDGNNSTWVTCHIIKYAGLNTSTSFTNASFPFNAFVYSAGSTTDLVVSCASFNGSIEGKKMLHGPRASFLRTSTTVDSAAYWAMFTVMNPRIYNGVANQVVINAVSFVGALKHTSPCLFYIIKNGALVGNPVFTAYGTGMVALWDTAATQVTFSDNNQLVYTDHLGDTGNFNHQFGGVEYNGEEFTIQPGEWFTIAARAVTGSPTYVTAGLNTREDQ